MATQKSASQILLAGGLAGAAGYGLYRNKQNRNWKPGQKKSILQNYGGLLGAGAAGYFGYKLDRARGGTGTKGALLGGGGFLAAQKLGLGKTLGLAAIGGAAYLAYKAMPTQTKTNIQNSKVGGLLKSGVEQAKEFLPNRKELAGSGQSFVKNLARYEGVQGMKRIMHKALGGGIVANMLSQAGAQLAYSKLKGPLGDKLKNAKIGGATVDQHIEEFKNPRLKAIRKQFQSGQIDKDKYDTMVRGAKDRGYVQEALGSTKANRQYLGGINKQTREIDKKLKDPNISSKERSALINKRKELKIAKFTHASNANKKANKLRQKDILGIKAGDTEVEKSLKRDAGNDLLKQSNYISTKQQMIEKNLKKLQSEGKGNTPKARKLEEQANKERTEKAKAQGKPTNVPAKKSNAKQRKNQRDQFLKEQKNKKLKSAQTLKPTPVKQPKVKQPKPPKSGKMPKGPKIF